MLRWYEHEFLCCTEERFIDIRSLPLFFEKSLRLDPFAKHWSRNVDLCAKFGCGKYSFTIAFQVPCRKVVLCENIL